MSSALRSEGSVPWRRLQEVARLRNGRDYKNFDAGTVPVYGTGGVMTTIDTSVHDGPSVLIPRKGSLGNLFYVERPFWTVDTIFYTEIDTSQILPKFFFYFLQTQDLAGLNQAGGIPSLTQTILNEVRVPVPPLEAQHEVVLVLDAFTELEAELEAELGARRQQYEFYRDSLLSFRTETPPRWIRLSDSAVIYGGLSGKSKQDFSEGDGRFVAYTDVFARPTVDVVPQNRVRVAAGERQNRVARGDVLFTASSESAAEVGMSSVVMIEPDEPLYLNSFCFGLRFNDSVDIDPSFARHLFRSSHMRRAIARTASGVTRFNISKDRFRRLEIPLPPLSDQKNIASTLDALDALVNDLASGLPAEIEARRTQYEYYRDRLLTF